MEMGAVEMEDGNIPDGRICTFGVEDETERKKEKKKGGGGGGEEEGVKPGRIYALCSGGVRGVGSVRWKGVEWALFITKAFTDFAR